MDVKHFKPPNVNLRWTFNLSRLLGVSILHTRSWNKCHSLAIQCLAMFCMIFWFSKVNVFKGKSMNGVTFALLHLCTTSCNAVVVFICFRKAEKAAKAVQMLDSMDFLVIRSQIDKTLSFFTCSSLVVLVFYDVYLETKPHYTMHLENCSYYIPVIQILMVSNQFMGLVKHLNLALDSLLAKLNSSERPDRRELINHYNDLHAVCKLINDSFSLQNLIVLAHHVFATIIALYYLIEALLHMYPEDVGKKKLWLSSSSSALYSVLIYLKFGFCQAAESKAKEFKMSLYDTILAEPDESLQFSPVSPIYKKIKFSAFDIVDINFKALSTITMTIITYQVILLQFTPFNIPLRDNLGNNTTLLPPEHYG